MVKDGSVKNYRTYNRRFSTINYVINISALFLFKGILNSIYNLMEKQYDVVNEIDFCDKHTIGDNPIVLYSSISKKPDGKNIYLINIETLNNSNEISLEIFGTKNYYKNVNIKSNTNNDNKIIYSFRCDIDKRYFIKIETETEEYGIDTISVEKEKLLLYGFYQFDSELLDNIVTTINAVSVNKIKKNINLSIKKKPKKYSFINTINNKEEDVQCNKDTNIFNALVINSEVEGTDEETDVGTDEDNP